MIPDQLRTTASRTPRLFPRTFHVGRSLQRAGYAVLLAVVLAPTVRSETVYSTIDFANGGGNTRLSDTNFRLMALSFQPSEDATITQLGFNFYLSQNDGTSSFNISLYDNSGTGLTRVPGSLITTIWNGTPAAYTTATGQTIPTAQTDNNNVPYFSTNIPVEADTNYWLVLSSSSTGLGVVWEDRAGGVSPSGSWYSNTLNNGGLLGRSNFNGTGWDTGLNYLGGNMQVEIQAVPEPTTLPLAGLGVAVIAWGCRRARRRAGLTG